MSKDRKKTTILSVLILPIFFSGLFAGFSPCKQETPPPMTLEFWSVFDDSLVYQTLIRDFQKQYPYITINYRKKDITTYEKDLVDALAAGRGPDIFSIHNTWVPKHAAKLYPAPAALVTPKKFQEIFVDVASQDFIVGDQVAALPLSVDTLALFYNKDLLNSAGISNVPKTWAEFNTTVEKLTRRDSQNNILQAGAALGTAKNVNRSTDILAMLMIQSGAQMTNENNTAATFASPVSLSGGESFNPGEQALIFYTSFANPAKKVYTWNRFQHYSLDAFVEGKAAMMINYAYQIPIVRARAPHLNFDVAAIPQISKTGQAVTFANYWGQAVSKTSKYPTYAWQFVSWLSGPEIAKRYLEATKKPTARRDLIDWQKDDPEIGLFAVQALRAKSWWEADNLAVEKIFADMIEAVTLQPSTAGAALQRAVQQVSLLMQKR